MADWDDVNQNIENRIYDKYNAVRQIVPRPTQTEALISLDRTRKEGKYKALVVLPSGLGKTYLSAFDYFKFLEENKDARLLFIAHTNEILKQAHRSYADVGRNNGTYGFFNRVKKESGKQMVFSSIQTLSKYKNLDKFDKYDFDYIVVDEFHHSLAETYQRVIDFFHPKFLLGLTATPYRLDGKDVRKICDNNVVFEMDLSTAINDKLLVPFTYYGEFDNIDYSDITQYGYKYSEKDLNKKLLIDERDEAILKKFNEKIGDKRTIGFCCSIKHINRCVKKFKEAGIVAEGLTHKEKPDDRLNILNRFSDGQIQVLFVRDILNEGVDFPNVEALLLLRPTLSKTVFFQQFGRGLHTKLPRVFILDFVGNYWHAYKLEEWLGKRKVDESEKRCNGVSMVRKPIYEYPLGCDVWFDDNVIDIFEGMRPKTLDDLKDMYFKLKNVLCRVPTMIEFQKVYHINWEKYYRRYGMQFSEFQKKMGDKGRYNTYSKEELCDMYLTLNDKIGRTPTRSEFQKEYRFNYGLYKKKFNLSFVDFRKELKCMHKFESFLTKDELRKKYVEFKNKFKKIPNAMEFSRESGIHWPRYKQKYGISFPEFKEEIGDRPRYVIYSKDELRDKYIALKIKLGKPPCENKFGKEYRLGWKQYKKSIGLSFPEFKEEIENEL